MGKSEWVVPSVHSSYRATADLKQNFGRSTATSPSALRFTPTLVCPALPTLDS
ncbi:hypothetical protein H6G89_12035 [Oscillatoria sp. FACHB-1407]|uniref:hypothetical protein n=1 Tax=Oscillatoria sp. FACHB-1407 TaxID=2692847 RepID=UPI001687E59A|nr:hypothetical protein [Oscillatoria sp. FACHB-1407]MBD2461780.1 hypothetical protein [Oscillatoria sp. FACHB-1407]